MMAQSIGDMERTPGLFSQRDPAENTPGVFSGVHRVKYHWKRYSAASVTTQITSTRR
jgi:hypothetical protein